MTSIIAIALAPIIVIACAFSMDTEAMHAPDEAAMVGALVRMLAHALRARR